MSTIHDKSNKNYLLFDNHMHLRSNGRFLGAVNMFIKAGGNAFNLVNLTEDLGPLSNRYEAIYNQTIKMSEIIRSEMPLDVVVTLGPYPLDYFLFTDHGVDPMEYMKAGIDLAAKYILEGKANAIGEIGRPHFPVSENVTEVSNEVIIYAMSICKDLNCPLILHTEDLSPEDYKQLEKMALDTGIRMDKIVKHHAGPLDVCLETKIQKSVLASRANVREISKCKGGFLLETDYVDDPASGWKVIPPDSVPKRAVMMREEISDWESLFDHCFFEEPITLYGEDAFARNLRL